MTSKILRIIQTTMIVGGICALGGCAEHRYYGGGPDYAYATPSGYGPAYYPPTYVVPERRVIVEHPVVAREHEEHERHEAVERHEAHENHDAHDHDDRH